MPAASLKGLSRRGFMATAAGTAMAGSLLSGRAAADTQPDASGIRRADPITPAERAARLARLQQLMRQNGIGAAMVEAGSSLFYFTGINWWRSERLTAALLPADGEICIVTPEFEEPSIREMLVVPGEVRIWNEHQNPHQIVADWAAEQKLGDRPMAIEDTVRFFAVDGLRKAAPSLQLVSAEPIVTACRMIKTAPEIALMQEAADIVDTAYRSLSGKFEAGMDGSDIFAMMSAAISGFGGQFPSGGVQINEGSALPHGSKVRETIKEGSVILMDCGCRVDGYYADISRTLVFGEPSKRQRKVFQQVCKGQAAAMAAAQPGAEAGKVDDAVRALYESMGYGPGYGTPGLPHRTGHGIGLDIHEPVNLVHGEKTRLRPGMCFSNEPGLYIPGEFGVRIEDCFYITDTGPKYFTQPPTSLDAPFG
ncbi:hypothetical protein HY29_06020 [Hyphomonas beringensis]|uniref:Peptidase n=2 Tax=Hyphomonas beringensis TaxID=1280946 RepID=A0A062TTW0_9PROT|nr:hypothetical protein HY29_06020 [Hyphomonas beringensis]